MQVRIRALAVLAIGSAGLLGLSAGALATEDPVDLGGDAFVDTTGDYADDAAEIATTLEERNADSDADVYAVVVDSFDGLDRGDWAVQTAEASGLPSTALLVAVAMGDQQWGYARGGGFPLSDAEVNQLGQSSLVPGLDNGDVPGAITGFSAAVVEAAAGGGGSGGTGSGGSGGTEVNVDGSAVWPIVALVGGGAVVGVGAWGIARGVRANRRRKGEREAAQQQQLSLDELKQRADIALVQLDDTVQQSEQELAFAGAQFGDDAVRPYQEALQKARDGLREAFQLQQQLDDAFPDTDQERHDWSSRILQIADGAGRELAGHAASFDQLRDLEHTAPQAIEHAAQLRTQLGERIGGSRRTLEQLARQHTGSSIAPIQQNIAGAERLLPAVDEAIAVGRQAVAAGDGSKAAVAVRTAEAELAQASGLLAGVERAEDDLATASQQLAALVEDSVGDIATARSLPRGPVDLRPLIDLVEQGVAQARAVPVDTLQVLSTLQRANQRLDEATGQVRAEGERQQRAAGDLQRWIASARSNIDMADQYIRSRRIGIGSRARQHLAGAQDALAQAIRFERQDPAQAIALAQQASQLAEQAQREANDDVDHWSGPGGVRNPYYRRGGYGGGRGDGWGGGGGGRGQDMLTGGLLGYVLGDMLSGGHHGGYGGGQVSDPFASGGGGGGGLGDLFSGGGGSFGGGGGGFFGGGFGGFSGGGGDFGGGGGGFGD
ncbi:TPM domain-containing protein [Agrococcus terreus]|uniref:TPM domain-containing protein n=1 Tax=Agrococcus terreus TaxID=574649 RepID=A0ABQ2KMK2_9MICO|nr:TPM domain-containing protein [Agrococcus terreus]GGN87010.1 hypothetical protein GCM10010968_21110 [Agrococcus terreus]